MWSPAHNHFRLDMTSRASFLFFSHPSASEPMSSFCRRSIFCWCTGISTRMPTMVVELLTIQLKQADQSSNATITLSIMLLLCVALAIIFGTTSSIISLVQHTVHHNFNELNNCPARPTLSDLIQHQEGTTSARSTEAIGNVCSPLRQWWINRSSWHFIKHDLSWLCTSDGWWPDTNLTTFFHSRSSNRGAASSAYSAICGST